MGAQISALHVVQSGIGAQISSLHAVQSGRAGIGVQISALHAVQSGIGAQISSLHAVQSGIGWQISSGHVDGIGAQISSVHADGISWQISSWHATLCDRRRSRPGARSSTRFACIGGRAAREARYGVPPSKNPNSVELVAPAAAAASVDTSKAARIANLGFEKLLPIRQIEAKSNFAHVVPLFFLSSVWRVRDEREGDDGRPIAVKSL